jgi:hypothetical protein
MFFKGPQLLKKKKNTKLNSHMPGRVESLTKPNKITTNFSADEIGLSKLKFHTNMPYDRESRNV